MNAVSVSQLNNYVKQIMDSDMNLKNISVRGEISGFKHHSSGHMYFTLKDSDSVIKSVMFRQSNAYLRFRPVDGMSVVATGSVSVFPRDGQYQLYVNKLENDGEGALYVAFEKMKKALADEGLFDISAKKPIPAFVRSIAVVTSPTGAVIRDIIRVATRRFPDIRIVLYPVKVQGVGAAQEIADAICEVDKRTDIDCMIVGRGGGSIEDLWAFNEEVVARAIYEARTPIISAVGHETDFTISDFVADLRAATPSAAAELAVAEKDRLLYTIEQMRMRLRSAAEYGIEVAENRLKFARESRFLKYPDTMLNEKIQRADYAREKLEGIMKHSLSDYEKAIVGVKDKLNSLNPMSVLSRGYSIVSNNGSIVTSIEQLSQGDEVAITLCDGTTNAVISPKKEEE